MKAILFFLFSLSVSSALLSVHGPILNARYVKRVIASVSTILISANIALADGGGANLGENNKILKGGASTLQQGISKTITRGVNLDGSDFHGLNLKGVAFQQSIVRDANFKDCNLRSAGKTFIFVRLWCYWH